MVKEFEFEFVEECGPYLAFGEYLV